MASILDGITGLVNPQLVSQVAGRLGEPEPNVQRGMQTTVTTLMAAMANKAGDAGFMRTILDTGKRFASDPAASASAAMGSAATVADTAGSPVTGLLSSLFGGSSTTAVSTAIAGASGLRPESASSLLTMGMPLVLGWLGHRARQEGMDASGLGAWLGRERTTLANALPSGLGSLLGASGVSMPKVDIPNTGIPSAARMPPMTTSRNWIPAALAGLLAVLLIGYFTLRHKPAETVVAQNGGAIATDTAVRAPAPAMAAVDSSASAVSGMIHETIPGGIEMTVAPNGIEARMIQFIKDSSARVNDTTWFNFDRLLFETGSATLKPESQAQLKTVAQILQAYPNVKARIGGYTDNSGDAAANMKLSESRAQNVRAELEKLGVASDRLDAKGYGDEHPVGDNSTADGRAANRRIALRVTAK
jgi:OmpA-OmpF porin, OOP family